MMQQLTVSFCGLGCLVCPPFLLHRGGGDLPNSQEALQKLSDVTLVPVSCSELEKAGAGLSSLCLVLSTRPHS